MERRKFIKTCCYTAVGLPVLAATLQSCSAIYYATSSRENDRLILSQSEFWNNRNKKKERPFVLVEREDIPFPICVYKAGENEYVASLLECTHRGCELEVGGGIYSCPCHGSEFSVTGKVLEGPADRDLQTFKIETDNENIYISLS